jgi:hypothetical protein
MYELKHKKLIEKAIEHAWKMQDTKDYSGHVKIGNGIIIGRPSDLININRMQEIIDTYKNCKNAEEIPYDAADEISDILFVCQWLISFNPILTYAQFDTISNFIRWVEWLGSDNRPHLRLV